MNAINISDLRRFDFTTECKTCKYRRELGLLEYCCGFVIDEIRKQRFELMKDEVFKYISLDEDLTQLDPNNIVFQKDDEWGVTLTFQTNLKEDKKIVLSELKKAIEKSIFFTHVNFKKNSFYKKEFDKDHVQVQSLIDEFIDKTLAAG